MKELENRLLGIVDKLAVSVLPTMPVAAEPTPMARRVFVVNKKSMKIHEVWFDEGDPEESR